MTTHDLDEVTRSRDYFKSEAFDCSPAFLLKELASRAEYWSRRTDGTYSIPTGETGQIYAMAIAANLKGSDALYWRDLEVGEEIKVGDRFYNSQVGKWVTFEKHDKPLGVVKERTFPVQRLVGTE
ncbi:hypothetical protein O1C20_003464 [Vibrio cholerae]|nr:hypothetical protein [Vibrio cholerae]ELH0870607.1 hypothetical protein [Vibrio cholerae]